MEEPPIQRAPCSTAEEFATETLRPMAPKSIPRPCRRRFRRRTVPLGEALGAALDSGEAQLGQQQDPTQQPEAPPGEAQTLEELCAQGVGALEALRSLEEGYPSFAAVLREIARLLHSSLQRRVSEQQEHAKNEVQNTRREPRKDMLHSYNAQIAEARGEAESALQTIQSVNRWHFETMQKLRSQWEVDKAMGQQALRSAHNTQKAIAELQTELSLMYESQAAMWVEYASMDKLEDEIRQMEVANHELSNQKGQLQRQLTGLIAEREIASGGVAALRTEVERMAHEISRKTTGMQLRVEAAQRFANETEGRLKELKKRNDALAAERAVWEQRYKLREARELKSFTPRPSPVSFGAERPSSTGALVELLAKKLTVQFNASKRFQDELTKHKKIFGPIAEIRVFMSDAEPRVEDQQTSAGFIAPMGANVPSFCRRVLYACDEKWTLGHAEKASVQFLRGLSGQWGARAHLNDAATKVMSGMWSEMDAPQKMANLVKWAQFFAVNSPACHALSLVLNSCLPYNFLEVPTAMLHRVLQSIGGLSQDGIPLNTLLTVLQKEYTITLGQVELQQARYASAMDAATRRHKVNASKLLDVSDSNRTVGLLFRVVLHHFVSQHSFVCDALESCILRSAQCSATLPKRVAVVAEAAVLAAVQELQWVNNDVKGERGVRYSSSHVCQIFNPRSFTDMWLDGIERLDGSLHLDQSEKRKGDCVELAAVLSALRQVPFKVVPK